MNRKMEYALIALKHMSHKRPGELSAAKEIADAYGCSFDTIARLLQIMTQKGWLHSTQGVSGGYIIVKDLAKVSFYDLSVLILGPINLVRCISSSCQIKRKCNIVSPVQNLNDHLIEFYQSLSIHSLLEEPNLEPVARNATNPLHQSISTLPLNRINNEKHSTKVSTSKKNRSLNPLHPPVTEKDL